MVIGSTLLAGCSHQAPEYFWTNADSGEYLFAFDTRECGGLAHAEMPVAATPVQPDLSSPAFFSCMRQRGYSLVDPKTGHLLTADAAAAPQAVFAPQAAR